MFFETDNDFSTEAFPIKLFTSYEEFSYKNKDGDIEMSITYWHNIPDDTIIAQLIEFMDKFPYASHKEYVMEYLVEGFALYKSNLRDTGLHSSGPILGGNYHLAFNISRIEEI